MVIHLFTNISFGPVLVFFLAYTPINVLPFVEAFLISVGVTKSKVRSYMWSRGFCLFFFLLDKPWVCHAEDVRLLHFYLYLIALNSNLQNTFLQQFTCLS